MEIESLKFCGCSIFMDLWIPLCPLTHEPTSSMIDKICTRYILQCIYAYSSISLSVHPPQNPYLEIDNS